MNVVGTDWRLRLLFKMVSFGVLPKRVVVPEPLPIGEGESIVAQRIENEESLWMRNLDVCVPFSF